MTITELQTAIAEARAAYQAAADKATKPELFALSRKVSSLQKQLGDLIADGASPCPDCKSKPVGMVQQTDKGRRFEVGCPQCSGAFKHSDGTMRKHRVKDALMPQHAVEAWNAGPDFWMEAKKDKKAADQ